MDDLLRLVMVTVLAAMLLGLAERTSFDERGLRVAAAPGVERAA